LHLQTNLTIAIPEFAVGTFRNLGIRVRRIVRRKCAAEIDFDGLGEGRGGGA